MNLSKTKIMSKKQTEEALIVDGSEIEKISEYRYLGQILLFEDQMNIELRTRIAKG